MVNDDNNPYEMNSPSQELPLNDAPVSFPRRALLGSLAVKLPWPMFGIVVCMGLSLFDNLSEAIFMFGSVTMLLLLPLAFIESSEWIIGVLIGIVWLLVLFLPVCFGRTSFHPRFHVVIVLVCQSLFSAIQAAIGFLVVLGKHC